VPATRRELVDLCHSEEIKGSPFFNIFATIILRPFSKEDSKNMIQGYSEGSDYKLKNRDIEFIQGLAGGYPFFTQMAGMYFCQGLENGKTSKDLYNYVIDSFSEQADQHFTYFWSHSSESERITLLATMALNRSKQSNKKPKKATRQNIASLHARAELDINDLLKRGLLIQEKDEYHIFSPSLQQWISYEISAAPGEEESADSVEDWLKTGGDEKLNPVKGVLPRFKKKYWPTVSVIAKDLAVEIIEKVSVEMILTGIR
jgi:hypothetical protein